MNKRNLARVAMFEVLLLFFARYTATVNRVPALRAAVDHFLDLQQQIKEAQEQAMLVTEGITADKKRQRGLLSQEALLLAGAVSAQAHDSGDAALKKEMDFSRRDLDHLPGADFTAQVRRMATLARTRLPALGAYGITDSWLAGFIEMTDVYEEKAPAPRGAINERSIAGKKAAALVAQSGALLRNTIDKLMLLYRKTDPDFYSGYRRSRIIVDAATAGTSLLLLVSGPDAQPLPAVEVRIDGTESRGITDARGRCLFHGLEPGTRRIIIYHRNYAQKTLEQVTLKPGKMNKVSAAW